MEGQTESNTLLTYHTICIDRPTKVHKQKFIGERNLFYGISILGSVYLIGRHLYISFCPQNRQI